jgi:hypothetical protein
MSSLSPGKANKRMESIQRPLAFDPISIRTLPTSAEKRSWRWSSYRS